jgi:translation elongation factor EF-G
MTQGQGTFTLEFSRYNRLPPSLEREIIDERKAALAAGTA